MTDSKAATHGAPKTARFNFSGEAGEFFGIWFVNNILSMITLGFYSPWAKIRNLQYFYGNTTLAGSSFQFTANPWALLRTRIIAVLLLLLYVVSENLSTTLTNTIFAGFIIGYFTLMPVFVIFVLSFRTRYSVWRGVSFSFNHDYMGAYRVYLAPLVVFFLLAGSLALPFYSEEVEQTLGIPHYESMDEDYGEEEIAVIEEQPDEEFENEAELEYEAIGEDGYWDEDVEEEEEDLYINPYLFIPFGIMLLVGLGLLPYFDFINVRFLVRNSRFGNGEFTFLATARVYYALYGKWYLASMILAGLWVGWFLLENIGATASVGIILLTAGYLVGSRAYFKSRRANILINNSSLTAHHQLAGYIPFWSLLWLMLTNSIVSAITFGLMGPWARIRTARFMLERIHLKSTESLDEFVEQQNNECSSLAEEVADAFDLDLI